MSYSPRKTTNTEPVTSPKRTWYGCAAKGCPNAGDIDDRGESNPGKCFWHWQASAKDWPEISARIRTDGSMGNHSSVPCKPSKHVAGLQAEMKGYPFGFVNANTGTPIYGG